MGRKVVIRDVLLRSLEGIPDSDVAVFLSAGIDSRSILYGLLEVGKTPHAYSFTLADRESRDFSMARAIARSEGVDFHPILLPTSKESLLRDVYNLHDALWCRKKTEYVCTWPFLYAYRAVEERYISDGMCADGHFCLSKRGMMHYRDRVDEFRMDYWGSPNCGQRHQHELLQRMHGKVVVRPYMKREMIDRFWGSTWDDVNRPRQKQPILDCFPEKFASQKVFPHTNLQLGDSGISEHFDLLLDTKLNTRGYKSAVGPLREVNRGLRV